ncbi:ATP-binding protein [Methanobacterium alcaliphilum]|uniref:ATP-binding protein n=1 Tax=Methanobacterium alcaliphilum TaxID=392018 RepID=UPI00200B3D57|nr:ATP-binding protein [Methanobacterium alcaliphilum]MCK9151595.1 ATP-binding protein [Methanobacterium alcaliphilum]
MSYYHDEQMESIFEKLKQPKKLEDLRLSEVFVRDLLLKIISTHGTVKTSRINEMTGIHWDILEEQLRKIEQDGFCAQIGGSFLFSSIDYTITKKGREKAKRIMEENPYIGIAPVSYDNYWEIMDAQLNNRHPVDVPEEIIEKTFSDVVGLTYAKECLVESCTIGKGIFVYGSPGTGKTFIVSKTSDLLPPLIIPKYMEFGGKVVQLYDPDFHRNCPEQPSDPRWVKIHAPFVFTGSELNLNKLETTYNPNKGVYETSPMIKANGGILLVDDLGRQRDDHELILNRLIVPMENKKDVIYVRGVPVIVHSHFIPAFSTNLDVSIMDEAHLRRAPLHIFLKNPPVDNVAEVFKRNLDLLKENYDSDVIERLKKVYTPTVKGGEGLEPSYAHARDLAQICQAARITLKKDVIDIETLEEALNKHVLISLQRMNIDISQVQKKIRTFRITTAQKKEAYHAVSIFGADSVSCEAESVIADLDDIVTPTQLASYLKDKNVTVNKVEIIAESERELRKTILEYEED